MCTRLHSVFLTTWSPLWERCHCTSGFLLALAAGRIRLRRNLRNQHAAVPELVARGLPQWELPSFARNAGPSRWRAFSLFGGSHVVIPGFRALMGCQSVLTRRTERWGD
jgi:hypothetical protein